MSTSMLTMLPNGVAAPMSGTKLSAHNPGKSKAVSVKFPHVEARVWDEMPSEEAIPDLL